MYYSTPLNDQNVLPRGLSKYKNADKMLLKIQKEIQLNTKFHRSQSVQNHVRIGTGQFLYSQYKSIENRLYNFVFMSR